MLILIDGPVANEMGKQHFCGECLLPYLRFQSGKYKFNYASDQCN